MMMVQPLRLSAMDQKFVNSHRRMTESIRRACLDVFAVADEATETDNDEEG